MYHFLPVFGFGVLSFWLLVRRMPLENAFYLVSWFPVAVFLVGFVDEFIRGIRQVNHQLLHVAYDASYLLTLLGIVLILRTVILKRVGLLIIATTFLAGLPLGHILLTKP
jgi:hypothetical protein